MAKRQSGLHSFLRREWARKQAGVGSFVPKPVDHVISSCMTGTPYKLPEEQDKMLRTLANKDCFRCKGTGVTKWKMAGKMANVCVCVQRKLPEMQAKLEEQQARIAKMVAEEKAKLEPRAVKPEPPPLTGKVHKRPDGGECSYLAEGFCNKCGWVEGGNPSMFAKLKMAVDIFSSKRDARKAREAMCPHARPAGTPCPHCLGVGEKP